MLKKEQSPLGASILANTMGIGKTLTYLLLVLLSAKQKTKLHFTGTPQKFAPTLLVVPAMVLPQIYAEIITFFSKELEVKVFYGSASSASAHLCLRLNTIETHEFSDVMHRLGLGQGDPQVIHVVQFLVL